MFPQAFEKLVWGASAVGLRATLSKADSSTVQRLLEAAWMRRASKKAVAAWLAGQQP